MAEKHSRYETRVCLECKQEFALDKKAIASQNSNSQRRSRKHIKKRTWSLNLCKHCNCSKRIFENATKSLARYLKVDLPRVREALKKEGWSAAQGISFLKNLNAFRLSDIIAKHQLGTCKKPQDALKILQDEIRKQCSYILNATSIEADNRA